MVALAGSLLLLLVFQSPVRSAYSTAVVSAIYASETDGAIRIAATCVGTAGDPDATITFSPTGLTALEMRARVWTFCDQSARNRTLLGAVTIGQSIARPPAPPAPTTQEQFFLDLARWYRVNAAIQAGILTGTETEVVAFKNAVKSAYQASYLPAF